MRARRGLKHVGIHQRLGDKFSRRCRERELRLTLDVLGDYYGALDDIVGAEGIMVAILPEREREV